MHVFRTGCLVQKCIFHHCAKRTAAAREAHGACTSELRVVRRHRCSSRTSVHHCRRGRGRGHLLRQTRQLQKDQTEPAVSLPSTMSRIVNVRHYILVIVVLCSFRWLQALYSDQVRRRGQPRLVVNLELGNAYTIQIEKMNAA